MLRAPKKQPKPEPVRLPKLAIIIERPDGSTRTVEFDDPRETVCNMFNADTPSGCIANPAPCHSPLPPTLAKGGSFGFDSKLDSKTPGWRTPPPNRPGRRRNHESPQTP